ncbi:hypothetical protein AC579_2267 [Pseudocercospora musae]|uniref:Uncharacterized protein n=1 Tax=Pseudocercospora musae TaxID=113226 RepID=A0A139IVC2_9PEZI|nr:hypothetical protein AC579_2267 [Pseudocercospora musae]
MELELQGKHTFSLRFRSSPRREFPYWHIWSTFPVSSSSSRNQRLQTKYIVHELQAMAKTAEQAEIPSVAEAIRAIHEFRGQTDDAKANTKFLHDLVKDANPDGLSPQIEGKVYQTLRTRLRTAVQNKCPPRYRKQRVKQSPRTIDDLFALGAGIFEKEYLKELKISFDNEIDLEEEEDDSGFEEDGEPVSKKRKLRSQDAPMPENIKQTPNTHAPARPSEIVAIADQNCVTTYMERIRSEIELAMLEYCKENGVDSDASSTFVHKPEKELELLYKLLFGEEWQLHTVDLLDRGVTVQQDYLLMGLFGAAIHDSVLRATLPWDVKTKFRASFGTDLEYASLVVDDLGHDLDEVLKHIAGKQILDPKFQDTHVAEYAKNLVGELVLTLQPHLRQMTRREEKGGSAKPVQGQNWHRRVEKAFKSAIIIKQLTEASSLGPFGFAWVRYGGVLKDDKHSMLYEVDGARTVLHPVVSGIVRKAREEKLSFYRTVVVPAIATADAIRSAVWEHGSALAEKKHTSFFEVDGARSVLHWVVSGVLRKPRDEQVWYDRTVVIHIPAAADALQSADSISSG